MTFSAMILEDTRGTLPDCPSLDDSPSLVTTRTLSVGDSTIGVYIFAEPTGGTVTSNVIVNPDATGTAWTGTIRLTESSTPLVYDLDSTNVEEVIDFKVKSTFTDAQTHISA